MSLHFYEIQAKNYVQSTINVDMSALTHEFMRLLPPEAHILDVGCGSGRDSKTFIDNGFRVTAMDGSQALCALAQKHIKQPVLHKSFLDINWQEKFEGVWACASLLHCSPQELPIVFKKINAALKPSGWLYTSFKFGSGYRQEGQRYFLDMNEASFKKLLNNYSELTIEKIWLSSDRRTHNTTQWLNALIQKKNN